VVNGEQRPATGTSLLASTATETAVANVEIVGEAAKKGTTNSNDSKPRVYADDASTLKTVSTELSNNTSTDISSEASTDTFAEAPTDTSAEALTDTVRSPAALSDTSAEASTDTSAEAPTDTS
uniref:Uncharacterized protein n=1 Tax=Petromyzon marinus TaxID=7757 RepID=S4RAJ2_PETMA